MKITKAVILAAGEGSRMRPLTYTRPKVMLPLVNKPILEHLLLEMRQAEIRDFIFIVGYRDEQIRNYFEDGANWGVRIQYANQRKQLGTADALRMVKDMVEERFLLANGDIIIGSGDIQRLKEQTGNAVSAIELENVAGLGVIESCDGQVVHIYEKMAEPPSHLANAGLYLFTQDIFEAIDNTQKSLRGEFEITDSIRILIENGQSVTCHVIDQWLDISYPWDLLEVNEQIMQSLESKNFGEIEDRVTIKGSVSIGKGTVIRSGAYIVGPVIIGENCDIGPNCFIRASTAIGDNCHIGAAVEVKNSIVMSGTKIPHLNYVGDSVLGERCNLGAGTKIANLRLNKKNIMINGLDTGRKKLGAIFGDHVETGINSSINVGAMIGNDTFIGPGALVYGNISPDSKLL
jgi:bifunctional UDP-N-acetylglucosamine pyrophosphorylase/glucosamine-1-phosphate N-acetyltransferase